jgi:hypothetical protein
MQFKKGFYMLEPELCPHLILSDRLLKSRNINEFNEIIKDAKPGYTETNVAAMVMLSHTINYLSNRMEKLNYSSNRSGDGCYNDNQIQPENPTV